MTVEGGSGIGPCCSASLVFADDSVISSPCIALLIFTCCDFIASNSLKNLRYFNSFWWSWQRLGSLGCLAYVESSRVKSKQQQQKWTELKPTSCFHRFMTVNTEKGQKRRGKEEGRGGEERKGEGRDGEGGREGREGEN